MTPSPNPLLVPQVQMGWANFDGTPTIYTTTDAGLNRVKLTLVNALGTAVTLSPGTPVAWGSLPAGQSAIYLFFEQLLPDDQVKAIQVTAASAAAWSAASFSDESTPAYLVLAPAAEVTLQPGDGLEFELANLLAAQSIAGPVYATFAGAAGVADDQATTQVFVSVQNQPVAGNRELELSVGFAGSNVVFTGSDPGTLTLYLTNPAATPLVPGGAEAWGPVPPTFQLSLVFGDGAGALTTAAEAGSVAVNNANAYGNVWRAAAPQQQGSFPTWIMQPDPNGGGTVLGTGQSASIEFDISGIVAPGPAGVTYAYLSYRDIPGYNDGFFAVEILVAESIEVTQLAWDVVQINGISGNKTATGLANLTAAADIRLSFEVKNADYVTVVNTSYAARAIADFSDHVDVNIAITTDYTLIATNFATGQQLAKSLEVTVDPDPFSLVPKGTIVMWSGVFAPPPAGGQLCGVPVGWHLCDGTNGTPNLIDRFVLGTDLDVRDLNQTGGTTSHTHSATATVTVDGVGDHVHGMPPAWVRDTAANGNNINVVDPWSTTITGDTTQGAGAHTHTASSTVTVDPVDDLRPPYYMLAFIMKLY